MLPGAVRDAATVLYAFCRLTDDAVDLEVNGAAGLHRMRERLERAYADRPFPNAVDRAFAEVVEEFAIPRALPEALFDGCEWDINGRCYEDLEALNAYAARVAGSVGAMMALVMGVREPDLLARACDLGVAMQLSNIARDVGEDALAGRLYLPRQWLEEAGIDGTRWLRQPSHSEALGIVIQRLLKAADEIYVSADAGIERLPLACRPGIKAARILYAEIGREVERRGLDSISGRAVVPGTRKVAVLARAAFRPTIAKRSVARPPLEATRFLVDAVVLSPTRHTMRPQSYADSLPWWNVAEHAAWVIELFERLDRRDQQENACSRP
jgi:phytoene synthase